MRIEKVAILNEVVDRVKDSDYCFIINHGGVTVAQMAKLRADLRKVDSRVLVVKNTYLAKVAKEKGWSDEVNAMFAGQTAIVTGHGEPTAVAKAIMEFV
ncbi:MAG: 50S ribosomal protein L10, partial [Kiritimatiellae bacterium]|nr:50S ribosomal protein L10 [Kiritimatiellia bacterium]